MGISHPLSDEYDALRDAVLSPKTTPPSSPLAQHFLEHEVTRMDTLAGIAIKYGVEAATPPGGDSVPVLDMGHDSPPPPAPKPVLITYSRRRRRVPPPVSPPPPALSPVPVRASSRLAAKALTGFVDMTTLAMQRKALLNSLSGCSKPLQKLVNKTDILSRNNLPLKAGEIRKLLAAADVPGSVDIAVE